MLNTDMFPELGRYLDKVVITVNMRSTKTTSIHRKISDQFLASVNRLFIT